MEVIIHRWQCGKLHKRAVWWKNTKFDEANNPFNDHPVFSDFTIFNWCFLFVLLTMSSTVLTWRHGNRNSEIRLFRLKDITSQRAIFPTGEPGKSPFVLGHECSVAICLKFLKNAESRVSKVDVKVAEEEREMNLWLNYDRVLKSRDSLFIHRLTRSNTRKIKVHHFNSFFNSELTIIAKLIRGL